MNSALVATVATSNLGLQRILFQGRQLSKSFCLLSEKGSTLKEKNLFLWGANSSLTDLFGANTLHLEKDPFFKGISVQKSK